jgi:small neutral amino acid transporter SnatA (MarC family)
MLKAKDSKVKDTPDKEEAPTKAAKKPLATPAIGGKFTIKREDF